MRAFRIFVSFIASALALLAQSDRGTITGTVADPVGAVVANAAIEARNLETGATYDAATSNTGNFTLSQLPAGTYQVSATVAGFKKYVRENVFVQTAQTLRIELRLK
jgi:hypothetical protein